MLHGTVFMLLNEHYFYIFIPQLAKEENRRKQLDLATIKKNVTAAPLNTWGDCGNIKVYS